MPRHRASKPFSATLTCLGALTHPLTHSFTPLAHSLTHSTRSLAPLARSATDPLDTRRPLHFTHTPRPLAHTSPTRIITVRVVLTAGGVAEGGVASEGQAYGLLMSGAVLQALPYMHPAQQAVYNLSLSLFIGWRRMCRQTVDASQPAGGVRWCVSSPRPPPHAPLELVSPPRNPLPQPLSHPLTHPHSPTKRHTRK